MELFIEYFFSMPMVVFTIPFILFMMIWAATLLGLLDLEFLDAFFGGDSLDGETAGGEPSGDVDTGESGNLLSKLGLDGAPALVVFTLVDIYGLSFTYLARKYLMPLIDGVLTATAIGAIVAVGALVIAIPITAICVKPIKRFFVTHEGEHKDQLMGTYCIVKTQSVTDSFGQAVGDSGMIFNVRASEPNNIKQGDRVALLEYDSLADTYSVTTEAELLAMSSQPHIS